jgi:hypothetical protein
MIMVLMVVIYVDITLMRDKATWKQKLDVR